MAMKYDYTQKDKFDRFYTKDNIAKQCVEYLDLNTFSKIVEPSAGGGAFVRALNNKCEAYDLSVDTPWKHKDFLTTFFEEKNILFIGNPPFGKQGTLAIKFINHAARFGDTVAFILPNSFAKESMLKRLDKTLILKNVYKLPQNSFVFQMSDYDVPCSFFIFKKLESGERDKIKKEATNVLEFVDKENATFTVRRVGVNAGKASWNLECSPTSNYFIKAPKEIFKLFNKPFESIKWSVGPPSLSKNELIREINNRAMQS
jgi:hypothetical protein